MKQKINPFIERHPYLFGAVTLTILTLLVYGDVIFGSPNIVLSHAGTDLSSGIYTIYFYASELRQGHFPLWNPHLLGGYPWFASFQTLVLYPPAWIFLILPVGKAVNLFIALHVFLTGFGMFCWLKGRSLHPLSGVLAGALLMFSSTVTMQIYAGHVTPIASMAWAPYILWAVDGCFDAKYRLRWILAGTAFVALQIMGGFPQHVYYTALVVGIYVIGNLFLMPPATLLERTKVFFSVFACYLWGAFLCAIQFYVSFAAATETARQGKLPFDFAGAFSFPPLNFLTLLAPKVLGDNQHIPYWGHWYLWEMVLFIGITGLILSLYGIRCNPKKTTLLFTGLVLITGLIGLGFYTPFFTFLYYYVPGFGSFRANCRILFELAIFLTALAAMGYDSLLKSQANEASTTGVRWSLGITFFLIIAAFAAFWQSLPGKGYWLKAYLATFPPSYQQYLDSKSYIDSSSVRSIATFASTQFMLAAITSLIAGLFFIKLRQSKRFAYYLGILAVAEVMFFTVTMRPTFNLNITKYPSYQSFLELHPGDARFLKIPLDNWANALPPGISAGDISGYESFRLKRYDQFIQYSQGEDPNVTEPTLTFKKMSRMFALLRCRYFFQDGKVQQANEPALPHVIVIPAWQIKTGEHQILSALNNPHFNFRQKVLLEESPHFTQKKTNPAIRPFAQVLQSSADSLEIIATTPSPSILLVTDSYAKGWTVFPYPDSSQQKYDVMPADYVLRGIPLSSGRHHFRLQYAPQAFYKGRNFSIIALVIFCVTLIISVVKER